MEPETSSVGALTRWHSDPDNAGKRRDRLRLPVTVPRNWIQFATGDHALLHSAPRENIEAWLAE